MFIPKKRQQKVQHKIQEDHGSYQPCQIESRTTSSHTQLTQPAQTQPTHCLQMVKQHSAPQDDQYEIEQSFKRQKNERYTCCGDPEVRTNYVQGIISCQNCGLVHEKNIIETKAEYNIFSADQEHKRRTKAVGANGEMRVEYSGVKTAFVQRQQQKQLKDHEYSYAFRAFIMKQQSRMRFMQRVVDVYMQRVQRIISLKKADTRSFRSLKPRNQGAIILKHVLLEQGYTLGDRIEHLMSKVDGHVESELRQNVKEWFIVADDLQFDYDMKSFGKQLGLEQTKIDDVIRVAKDLQVGLMEGKQKKTIAAVAFYLFEGASRERDILNVFEFKTKATLIKNLQQVICYRQDLLPQKYL